VAACLNLPGVARITQGQRGATSGAGCAATASLALDRIAGIATPATAAAIRLHQNTGPADRARIQEASEVDLTKNGGAGRTAIGAIATVAARVVDCLPGRSATQPAFPAICGDGDNAHRRRCGANLH